MDREAAINDGSGYHQIYRMSHAQLPQVRHRQHKKICSTRLLLTVTVNVVVPSSKAAGSPFCCFYFHSNPAGNKQVEPAPSAQSWSRFKTVVAQDRCYLRHRTFVLFVFVHGARLTGLQANVKQFFLLDKTLTEVHTHERMNGLTRVGNLRRRPGQWFANEENPARQTAMNMTEGHLIEAWGDGVCEPVNPGGHAAWGIRICVDGKEVHAAGGYVGEGPGMSNNVAEYSAAVHAFTWVGQSDLRGILKLRMDSKLVINQLNGKWKVHREWNGLYIPYYDSAKLLLDLLKKTLGGVELIWIPRTENEACDRYSKKVLRDRGIKFRLQPEAVDR